MQEAGWGENKDHECNECGGTMGNLKEEDVAESVSGLY